MRVRYGKLNDVHPRNSDEDCCGARLDVQYGQQLKLFPSWSETACSELLLPSTAIVVSQQHRLALASLREVHNQHEPTFKRRRFDMILLLFRF